MFSVIVADDEFELRNAIINIIDWNSLGFNIIGEAENGVEALELVEKFKPDLLITDIRMPLLSGLELSKQVRETCPATQIVILSGYDEFEYARQAIEYNIIRYLTKPISSSELEEELISIRDEMTRRLKALKGEDDNSFLSTNQKPEILIPLILGVTESNTEEQVLYAWAQENKLITDEYKYFAIIVTKFRDANNQKCTSKRHINFIDTLLREYLNTESFLIDGRIVTILFLKSPVVIEQLSIPLTDLSQSTEHVLNEKCSVGVSRAVDRLVELNRAYYEALTARRYTGDGDGNIRFINDQERKNTFEFNYIEKTVFTFEQYLKTGKDEDIKAVINELFDERQSGNRSFLVIQLIATVLRTVSTLSDSSVLQQFQLNHPAIAELTYLGNEENTAKKLEKICIDARNVISSFRKRDSEILCGKVMEIINENYSNENLSLNYLSETLSVSPNYLSSLIKKTLNDNFIALLTKKRMEAAQDMLLCSQMKILAIAEKCGYNDQHYFSYCFKKFYGISPNSMRENTKQK